MRLRVFSSFVVLVLAVTVSGCRPDYMGLTVEEKLEDFRYVYDLFKENHGTISIAARMTGFDWLEHKEEFEEEVRRTRNDRQPGRL